MHNMNHNPQYEYSFLTSNGVDHQLISLYCANAITDGFTLAKYTNDRDWEENLQSFISTVIYRSQFGLCVTIAGLTLSRRFQSASLTNVANNIDDARRVFLIGYMIATKMVIDCEVPMAWWKQMVEREYDCSDLVRLENKFYRTVAWDVQIDRDEYFRGLEEAVLWYGKFIEEHTLPCSPLPTFQPLTRQRPRLPSGCVERIPVIKEGNSLSDIKGLPFPCTAAFQQRSQGIAEKVLRFSRTVMFD